MDLSLTEDQLGFKALARDFLDKEVLPHRAEWDRRESVDTALIPRLGEIGFFGLTIPEEYGGLGGDYITYCIGMEELGRADSSVRGIVSVSMGLVGIVAIVFSSKVNTLLNQGDFEGARRASANAKTWCWVATALAIIGLLMNIYFFSAGGMAEYQQMMEQIQQAQ